MCPPKVWFRANKKCPNKYYNISLHKKQIKLSIKFIGGSSHLYLILLGSREKLNNRLCV